MSKPRILIIHRQQTAVGYYRQHQPAKILRRLGFEVDHDETTAFRLKQPSPSEWLEGRIGKFDVILCDRGAAWNEIAILRQFVHSSPGCRMITDFDDHFLDVPKWNHVAARVYKPGMECHDSGLGHLRMSEMVTVSTPKLAEFYQNRTHAIRLAPNLIDLTDWPDKPVCPDRRKDKPIRILYGGAAGHYGDMDAIRGGLESFLRNPPRPIRLICFGTAPRWMHDMARNFPGRVIVLPWWGFDDYPAGIAWGGFDFAIAPRADHPFNLCSSNIKWLEAAAQGFPVVASNVGEYAAIPPNCAFLTENRAKDWEDALTQMTIDADLRRSLAAASLKEVRSKWTIDSGLSVWESIVEETLQRPRIETFEDTRLPGDQRQDLR